eukprot:CAMPEP_0184662660 /NCGR_PEP_ID=MMETSP0308-20130426/44288_1 /TAXON_ID=38269 /ORGANISM="Gloeochaete witrockiana, Strain SAG 46.84" /LENGTH=518 /DNA_ID=CAMNT_0027104835 /DNA_START=380 /DNA_END=1936 /DNA_ORIENTATION=-
MMDMDGETWKEGGGRRIAAIHQSNALRNWMSLVPPGNIIVFVDSISTCNFINIMFPEVRCLVHTCMNSQFELPQFDCIWRKAISISETDLIMFTNGDILFDDSLTPVIQNVFSHFGERDAVVVGERLDVEWNSSTLAFGNPEVRKHVFQLVRKYGTLHGDYAIDYFVMRRRLVEKMQLPEFLLGTWRWDNWLLSDTLSRRDVAVVDASRVLLAVHQGRSNAGRSHRRPGHQHNEDINKRYNGGKLNQIGRVSNAHYWMFPSSNPNQPSTFVIQPNPTLRASVVGYQYAARVHEEYVVAILIAENSDIEHVLAWVDHARSKGMSDAIVLTTNEMTFHQLRSRLLPVERGETAEAEESTADTQWLPVGLIYAPNATVPNVKGKKLPDKRVSKLEALLFLLEAGIDIVAGGPNALRTHLLGHRLQEGFIQCDVMTAALPHEGHMINSELIVRATAAGRNMFREIVNCVLVTMENRGLETSTSEIEDECINHQIFIRTGRNLSSCVLSKESNLSMSFPFIKR